MTDKDEWHEAETYKGLILIGQNAIKGAVILNGGAAVALLAFLSNILSKLECDSSLAVAEAVRIPMVCFVLGLALGGASYVLAYLMQLCLHNENVQSGSAREGDHKRYLKWAIWMVVFSYGVFAFGALYAAFGLT